MKNSLLNPDPDQEHEESEDRTKIRLDARARQAAKRCRLVARYRAMKGSYPGNITASTGGAQEWLVPR